MTHAPPGPAPVSLESRSARAPLAHNGARWLGARQGAPRLVRAGAGCMMLIEVRDHATGGAALVTVEAGAADRPTLASKIRGWKDDATGLEQRLKDVETIARSLRRRWWLVGTGLVLGLIGWAFWPVAVRTRPGTMVLVAGGGLILNALLGMINERGWYRWWLIYALALLDVVLVAVLIVWFGHGGFVVAFLISVLPYAFDQGHTVGNFLVLTAALAYLAAVQMHHALYGGDAALAPGPVLETD